MVDLAPFRALTYATDALEAVTAPPYDTIDAELAARLRARSPVNVVRLELAGRGEDDVGRYRQAAATYRSWVESGTLVPDGDPTMYAYEQCWSTAGERWVQRGVLGALGLVPWEQGTVLPHEGIQRRAVEDRLRLLEALPANTSPVMLTAREEPAEVAEVLAAVTAGPPRRALTDPDEEVEHRLWRLDEAAVDLIRDGYASARLLMADGHHRYTTALEYQVSRPGQRGADRILALVVAPASGAGARVGPVIRPMHRLVERLPDDAEERLRRGGLALEPLSITTAREADSQAVEQALGRRAGPVFGWITATTSALLVVADTARAERLRAGPPPRRDLDATLLDGALRGPLGLSRQQVLATADVAGAADAVAAGRADLLVLTTAVPVEDVWRVAGAGQRLPPKTTSFFPKPRTGLVLRPLDDRTVVDSAAPVPAAP